MTTVLTPQLKYEIVELIDDRIRERHVTKEDFSELKSIVKDIAIEQRKLASEQKELARAQKETQEELKALSGEVKALASEQKELARAQKETQEELKALSGEVKALAHENKALAQAMNKMNHDLSNTRRDVGGITSTLGYMLENEAYRILPNLLKDRYGIEVKERFLRRSIRSLGVKQEGEINIFSHGFYQDKGIEVVIIGEAKSQLNKDDIDDFLKTIEKLNEIVKGEKFFLFITHYTKETVVEYAKKKGIEVLQSFEW